MELIKGAIAGQVCEAMPVWLLIADKDARILYRNRAAARLVGRGKVYGTRLGEVLHCINSEEGCGLSEECAYCPVRGAVDRVMKGGSVERRKALVTVEDMRLKTTKAIHMLVTASPIELKGKKRCLLALEDISEITELRALLPICVSCKKIRNEKKYWEKVETYIQNHLADVEFSHGLCPECYAKASKEGKPAKTS